MSIHPTEIKLHQTSRILEVAFEDDARFHLPCEYLRVFSPSAEVRGHGPGTETLVTGKEQVNIAAIEPVGHYAVKLVFDDGHATGLYSWNVLYDLGVNQESHWQDYLRRLAEAGHERQA
ncbi:MAG: DUF971 domain-containing protein [Candidatus Competibacteraceae bacterium]|nr:DUF971 domain-containing protein [Candidatus Competibacteraceae bacterium]